MKKAFRVEKSNLADRRKFFYWVVVGIAIAALLFPSAAIVQPQVNRHPAEIRGVWITNVASGVLFSPWGINRALQQLHQLNFNTIYPVAWNRGHTFYPSRVAQRVTGRNQESLLELTHPGKDILALMVKQGHRQGLRVIPWFEYGFLAPVNSPLAKLHPDWITKTKDRSEIVEEVPEEVEVANSPPSNLQTSSQKFLESVRAGLSINNLWLNPFHPEVQKFLRELILEVVIAYDVDGIQLDDHFGLPVEFGYDSYTIQLYQQEHQGKSPPDNPQDPEWMRWRAGKITKFMQDIYQAIKTVKPDLIVSVSPNPYGFAYNNYLQDWQTWVQQGFIDELVLQVYRDDLNSFIPELGQPPVQSARSKIPVAIGISSGTIQRPVAIDNIKLQVEAVRSRNFSGVSFFYWESLWSYLTPESPQQRRSAFQELFSSS
ncbi:glycoside hydrolase family 10 protein [Oscillatoria salina]|uniref:glycoside hydrolase family 10 protein n=1 Tax=Oscillatoria salina TaxID=331517 RepID=UPI0013B98E0F|nr:glycoside hydrolase family 10 protein [Oscillatoria salina]MBZ8179992.1 family 10 glycosylhydrolase [Oscillatoria salina IIICB1]NET90346.1 family 10 glycosylhydrolase [Kamptonema sp. SIO1D9]